MDKIRSINETKKPVTHSVMISGMYPVTKLPIQCNTIEVKRSPMISNTSIPTCNISINSSLTVSIQQPENKANCSPTYISTHWPLSSRTSRCIFIVPNFQGAACEMRGNEIASASGANGKEATLHVVGIPGGVIAGSVCVLINEGIGRRNDRTIGTLAASTLTGTLNSVRSQRTDVQLEGSNRV
jgi:hypothetical protein